MSERKRKREGEEGAPTINSNSFGVKLVLINANHKDTKDTKDTKNNKK
jgi:hypothetical protein